MRLLIGGLALLASCHYLYGVGLRVDGPFPFDAIALQDVMRRQPGFKVLWEWDGTSMAFGGDCGWEYAVIEFGKELPHTVWIQTPDLRGGGVWVGSWWINDVPGDEKLFASLARQQEIVEMLARTVPGFPSPDAFQLEWIGLDFPLGDELAAAKARWEATAGKR